MAEGEGNEGTKETTGGPEGGESWTTSVEDDGVRGWLETKGYKTLTDAARAHRSLEQLHGVPAERILRLPENAEDAEAWTGIYRQLGAPDDAAGYEFPDLDVPEGQVDLREPFRNWALARGLTKGQAAGLFEDFQGEMQGIVEKQIEEQNERTEADMIALRKEWGQEFQANIQAGKQAAKALGLAEEEIGRIEDAIGTKKLFETFARIGTGIGEFRVTDPERTVEQPFGLNAAAAQAQLEALKSDRDFMDKMTLNPKGVERQRWDRLLEIVDPGTQLGGA
jgi:hypothetical protein